VPGGVKNAIAEKANQREIPMRERGTRVIISLALAALVVPGAERAVVFPGAAGEETPARPQGLAPEHVEANLVLVDVLVRDRNGKSVPALGKEDFSLLIDRLPAPIASFERNCGEPSPPPGSGRETPPAGKSEEPAAAAPPGHVVLVFDINHLTRPGRDRSLDAAVRYLKENPTARERVMLIAIKGRPVLLESFTSDHERLAARLDEVKADNEMIDLAVVEERLNMSDVLSRECGGSGLCQSRLNLALPYALAEELRARRSIDALKSLMPALAPIRGRKAVVYFSETLRDEPGLEYLILANSTSRAEHIDVRRELDDLQKEANSAGVAFYPVFAAGLGEGGGLSANDASIGRIGSRDTIPLVRATQAGEDGALGFASTLALETGGEALKRSNDLGKIFSAVSADLSCYYVIGYANPGPGDGKRHSIIVRAAAKEYEVRHRPYYEDLSEGVRLENKFRSVLMAPAYFRDIPATVDAFALAPEGKRLPFLLKVEFPLDEVTLVGEGEGRRAGEVEVRGTVWTGPKESCAFRKRFPITLESGETTAGRNVIYETGCELPAGSHDLTVAVLDGPSGEIGGAEVSLPVKEKAAGIVGDVLLWTSSGGDLLIATDATGVGIRDSGTGHGFVPRRERRFSSRESALLYAIICRGSGETTGPAAGASARARGAGAKIEVLRSVRAGEIEVAGFPPATFGAGEARGAGGSGSGTSDCEGIISSIPAGRLSPGGYAFELKVTGITPEPVVRRAEFAVEGEAKPRNRNVPQAP